MLEVRGGFSLTIGEKILSKVVLELHSHKWLTFDFTLEIGYTLYFGRRIAHNGSQGQTEGGFRMRLPVDGKDWDLLCERRDSNR